MVPVPCTSEGEETGAADTVPVPPAGSSPLCRLDEEGFCGFAGVGLVCAGKRDTGGRNEQAQQNDSVHRIILIRYRFAE